MAKHSVHGGDGSSPAIGEVVSTAGGGGPRTPRRGDRVAGLATDPTRSPEMDAHNAAAREALAAHNSGAADQGGPVRDPGNVLGGGVSGSGGTWADPSSQG